MKSILWFLVNSIVVSNSKPSDAIMSRSCLTDDRNILSLKSALASSSITRNGELVVGEDYLRQAGTSMAAPHVSGLAALIISQHPEFTNDQVKEVLQSSVDPLDSSAFQKSGHFGRINAFNALKINSIPKYQIYKPEQFASLKQEDGTVLITGLANGEGFNEYGTSIR